MATLKASPQGLVCIKQARQRKGWATSDFRWIESASEVLGVSWAQDGVLAVGVSEGTWKRFLAGKYPINAGAFKAYCQVLELDWQAVVETFDEDQTANAPSQPLVHSKTSTTPSPLLSLPLMDWGDAPDVSIFYGRQTELATIRQWAVEDQCRLITLLGMGGIGKTSLSIKLARDLVSRENDKCHFRSVAWRSLRNAPSVDELLADLIPFFSEQQDVQVPTTLAERIRHLLSHLRATPCLLILDNVESILQAGDRTGRYRAGYEGYGQLLRCIAETAHQSCLILTSREKPQGLSKFEGEYLPVRSLQLSGLPEQDGRELFNVKGRFTATDADWQALISRYAGNPLALKIVASSIHDYFDSDIASFLTTTQHSPFLFDDIRDLLDQQFQRLTPLEKDIMYWFAINREPTTMSDLQADFIGPVPPRDCLEALNSLQRRSLIEKSGSSFSQQPVVMEYVTTQFVEQVCDQICHLFDAGDRPRASLFVTHALLKASAKDYVREAQANLMVQPVVDQLLGTLGSLERMSDRLMSILNTLRGKTAKETGYAAGNAINLLHQAGVDLTGFDFSHLTVWQAYAQGIPLHNVDFTESTIARCAFTETLGNILWAAFSPDGKRLATCDTDCNVRIWDVQSGNLLLICRGHANWVRFVVFSPDGQTVASCGADCTIKLWTVQDGICIKTLTGHEHEVFAVAFSPDGQQLASVSGDCTIKLWDIRDGQCTATLTGHNNWVRAIAFSPDGRTLASSAADSTIKLWDVSTGDCRHTLTDHTGWVRSLAFSPEGDVLASASSDRTIKLWDYETGDCLRTYTGHKSSIYAIAFNPTGDWIISGSGDRTVRFWDCYSNTCVKTLYGHSNEVCCVAVSADDQTIACVSLDQTMRLWNYHEAQCLKTWYGHTDWALPVAFSPLASSAQLASGSNDKTVRLWNWQTGECLMTLRGHTDFIYSVHFSPNGQLLASGSTDCVVRLWAVQTGQCIQVLQGHTDWIDVVVFHPEGHILASGSADCTVRLWDVQTGQCIRTLTGHTEKLLGAAFSPTGEWIASCGVDRVIKLWEVYTGKCIKMLEGHTSRIWGVAFSPCGKILASCSTDQTVKLWNVETGTCLQTLMGHTNWVFAIAFSPDGHRLVSAAHDQTVRVWDVDTGDCQKICIGHAHLVSSVAFSPDGTAIASGSQDQTVRIWDAQTGACTKVLIAKRLYEGMKLGGVKGLTPATISTLQTLGAVL